MTCDVDIAPPFGYLLSPLVCLWSTNWCKSLLLHTGSPPTPTFLSNNFSELMTTTADTRSCTKQKMTECTITWHRNRFVSNRCSDIRGDGGGDETATCRRGRDPWWDTSAVNLCTCNTTTNSQCTLLYLRSWQHRYCTVFISYSSRCIIGAWLITRAITWTDCSQTTMVDWWLQRTISRAQTTTTK